MAGMAVYDFVCLDCDERFALDSRQPVEGTCVRCPACDATHVRQTFESYLRNADAARTARRLDEARCSHFG
jgi:predicted nucleic acid-binding Zn ribbon protein